MPSTDQITEIAPHVRTYFSDTIYDEYHSLDNMHDDQGDQVRWSRQRTVTVQGNS